MNAMTPEEQFVASLTPKQIAFELSNIRMPQAKISGFEFSAARNMAQAALFEVVKCLCGKDEDLRREVARCVRAGDYDWLTLFCDHPEAVIGLFRTYQEWANDEVGQKLKFTHLQTPTWSTD